MKTNHKHHYDIPVIAYTINNTTGKKGEEFICPFPCVKCSICGKIKRLNDFLCWGWHFRTLQEIQQFYNCEFIEGIKNIPNGFCNIDQCEEVYKYFSNEDVYKRSLKGV